MTRALIGVVMLAGVVVERSFRAVLFAGTVTGLR